MLHGATIHPVSGPEIVGGDLVFDGGKIVGRRARAWSHPAGAKMIDVTGKHVYPGLISAHTALGLVEVQSVRGTIDSARRSVPSTPNARAQVAINPDSELLPVARANGVLTALAVPKTAGGLIFGYFHVDPSRRLDVGEHDGQGRTVGLHVFWPELRIEKRSPLPAGTRGTAKGNRRPFAALAGDL